jgi:hypothetical protein
MLHRPRPADQRRSHRAMRQRRFRERQAAERMVVQIEVDRRVIDWLARTQWLTPRGECVSRAEICDAIERMIEDSARQ